MTEEPLSQSNGSTEPSPRQFDQFPPQGGFQYGIQQPLPNATAVLVLGILSLIGCYCYGIVGVILAIVALVLAKKDRQAYALNSALYTLSSYKNLNAGRICAIIGLILGALVILMYIFIIAMFGFGVLTDQQALKEAIQGLQ